MPGIIKTVTDFFKAPVDYFYNDAKEPSEDTLSDSKPSLDYKEQVTPTKGETFLAKNPRKKKNMQKRPQQKSW